VRFHEMRCLITLALAVVGVPLSKWNVMRVGTRYLNITADIQSDKRFWLRRDLCPPMHET
jgi:adenine-specific DNA glycosylase